jgi:hypothetical protein
MDTWSMNRLTIRWILFVVMFLTLPSMLFMVQAVMFIPAVFYVGGIFYMVYKLFLWGNFGETSVFILFVGVHLVVYFVLFIVIASVLATLISMIPSQIARLVAIALLCCAMVVATFFPVYGGGGHGPIEWVTLPELIETVERDYGSGSTLAVYGGTLVAIAALVGFRRWRRRTAKADTAQD